MNIRIESSEKSIHYEQKEIICKNLDCFGRASLAMTRVIIL